MLLKSLILIFFGGIIEVVDWPIYDGLRIGNALGSTLQALGCVLIGVHIGSSRGNGSV